ncbi:methyltransferase domain-containing protein [Paenibacillus sp. F6_3S_P_1C]|uniref:Methyltransferase domain-containing protein n=1 Tax=Paenibacillus vandeheii TaxID=3035917 RepID=A0ABT8JJR1_9BACL|nr:class I SAM-dependent methyltransferase [Paenibacillus vandeheii]MDN4605314.1 methyltransferase domain-containing protein [Paenibacillus vandeheii]
MVQWNDLNQESKNRWEAIAEFWDDYMGDESNRFHRELIKPYTEELLQIEPSHEVLDIACGNGNFSRRLSELGAKVTAFDYSSKMIERAKLRTKEKYNIRYTVIDATDSTALLELGKGKFDRAVANMALMDISDLSPLVRSLHELIKDDGTVVFSIPHPCFQTPKMRKIQETEDLNGELVTRSSIQTFDYLTPEPYQAIGIRGQSVPHFMFHRSLTFYFNLFFSSGFILDGYIEPSFNKETNDGKFDWYDIPAVCIFRFRKV